MTTGGFTGLGVTKKFTDQLDVLGYTTPTPIQEQAIPVALAGKDIFGCAQTGTGKTAAFSLPLLQRLDQTHDDSTSTKGKRVWIRGLILTPTRELAIQIGESIREYGKKCNLRSTVIYGGVSQNPQVKILRKGVEIVIATPGRLLDLINQKHVNLTQVEVFVLDEADRMLDMGFIRDIKKITNFIPKKRQTLFFSATKTDAVMELAHEFLNKPVEITVTPASSTVDTVSQALYTLKKDDKDKLLLHLLKDKSVKNAVVFTKTKHRANKVEKVLQKAGISSSAIHGNKSQNARQKALQALKSGKIRVLVATDIASRGIDVDELSHVIIYDVPLEPEVYVHRIGRTGRAGLEGDSVMFCEPSEVKYLKQVLRLIKIEIPLVKDHPYHYDISLTGPQDSSSGFGSNKKRSAKRNALRKGERGFKKSDTHQRPEKSSKTDSSFKKKRYSKQKNASSSRSPKRSSSERSGRDTARSSGSPKKNGGLNFGKK